MPTRRKTIRRKPASITKKQKDTLIKVGAVAGVGYLLLKSGIGKAISTPKPVIKTPSSTYGTSNFIPMDEPPAITAPGLSTAFPLGVGSTGEAVKMLQRALLGMGANAAKYIRSTSMRSNGDVDGIFGQGTKNALLAAGFPYPVSYAGLQSILS